MRVVVNDKEQRETDGNCLYAGTTPWRKIDCGLHSHSQGSEWEDVPFRVTS